MQPGVVIYTSNRLEDLLTVLAERLATDPLPPLVTETILVPGQGMARWLRFELASRHGIAAGLELPFPGAFLQQLSRAGAGGADPFAPDVLLFRIHRLLGDATLARQFGPAARYCEADPDGRKRFQLSRRIAACFDDYQLYRSDLLARAADGDDLGEVGEHGPWQARLWRALLADAGQAAGPPPSRRRRGDPTPSLFAELDEPAAVSGPPPAHRLQHLESRLADPEFARAVLPPRLQIFGPSTLPPALLPLLSTIARTVPVLLYVPQPAAHDISDQRPRQQPGRAGNALLARLGTEAREFQQLMVDLEGTAESPLERRDLHPLPAPPRTLLQCLQADIAAVDERGDGHEHRRYAIAPDDASVRVHDCHSEQRELEVVRDQILAAFADDPALQPHDVLVLVPDIERYAPYAHAVFGPLGEHLPFQVADKSPRSESPLCAAVFHMLRLAEGRLVVFDVLHLLEEPAVQRRFGLFASDLPALRHLCERAGIRWGTDGEMRRQRFDVPPFDDNSWHTGLERMLLGTATGPAEDLVLGRLPAADVTSGREELLARLLSFVHTVFHLTRTLERPQPLAAWADRLDALAARLFAPQSAADEQGLAELRRAGAELRAVAATAGHREPISALVLRDWLDLALGRAAASQGFLGGRVTLAAMLPMRAIPVKRLFLCGLDDQSFPRQNHPAPFDLVASHRRPGDRSARLDDRQMFLDCVLAARETLHVTHIGHSQKDDSECAPSVVLSELLDLLDRCCEPPPGHATPRAFVHVRHPLQPWSARYRADDPRLFTFAAGGQPRDAAPIAEQQPFWGATTTAPRSAEVPVDATVSLDDLAQFWWHPCRYFLRETLGIRLPRDNRADVTTEPFAIDNLERYRLLDEAIARVRRGLPPPRDPLAYARATGRLPVGGVGAAAFAQIEETAAQFEAELADQGELARRAVEVRGDDFTIRGELEGVGTAALVYARVGRLNPKDRLRAWLFHLVATMGAAEGQTLPTRTVMITRDPTAAYPTLTADQAAGYLGALVDGYRQGRIEPLPFFEKSSYAYGRSLHAGAGADDALRSARSEWLPQQQSNRPPNDSENPEIELCMRGRDALLLPGFARWAERIWSVVCSFTEKV